MKIYEKVETVRKQVKSLEEQARAIETSILGMRIKTGTINASGTNSISASTITSAKIGGLSVSSDLDEILSTITTISNILLDLKAEVVRPLIEV